MDKILISAFWRSWRIVGSREWGFHNLILMKCHKFLKNFQQVPIWWKQIKKAAWVTLAFGRLRFMPPDGIYGPRSRRKGPDPPPAHPQLLGPTWLSRKPSFLDTELGHVLSVLRAEPRGLAVVPKAQVGWSTPLAVGGSTEQPSRLPWTLAAPGAGLRPRTGGPRDGAEPARSQPDPVRSLSWGRVRETLAKIAPRD